MMADPTHVLKGIENDPSLLAELAALGLGGDEDMELQALLASSSEGAAGAPADTPSLSIPITAPGKPMHIPISPSSSSPAATDAFLANLGIGGGGEGGEEDCLDGLIMEGGLDDT
ncbi:Hypothetical protein NocV09_01302050, partial [Nannochloropsis oceanica]